MENFRYLKKIKIPKDYLGLKAQTWKEIPMLAVITGKNGAGKSHLFSKIKKVGEDGAGTKFVFGKEGGEDGGDIEMFSNDGRIYSWSLLNLWWNAGDDIVRRQPHSQGMLFGDIEKLPFTKDEIENLKQALLEEASQKLVGQENKEEIKFLEDNRIKQFNEFLKKYEKYLPHKIDYEGNFVKNGAKIPLKGLSSGEQRIVKLLYNAFILKEIAEEETKNMATAPLLLLDEYDVHLHPSFIEVFMKIIKKVFVEGCKIQVMLITHNPTTLSCVPKESIFFMKDGEIQKMGKEKAIRELTEKLYTEEDLKNILNAIVKVDSTNLFVEGKYDKKILETYLQEYEKGLLSIINIIALGGAQNITKAVNNIFATDKSTKFIALFDNDNDNDETKKAFDDLITEQDNIKKMQLPVNGAIENMFSQKVLKKNNCLNNKEPCKEKIAKECAKLLENDQEAQQYFKKLFNNIKKMKEEMEKQNKQ